MRFSVLLLSCLAALFVVYASAGSDPTPASLPTSKLKFEPRITPEYLELLKKQADLRKELFESQAKTKEELKAKHAKEREDLVLTHRAARKKFSAEKHTQPERAEFFKAQRADMGSLEARHKSEELALEAELNRRTVELHTQQRKERESLENRLARSHQ